MERQSTTHLLALLALFAAVVLGACGGDGGTTTSATVAGSDATGSSSAEPVTLRLGYFPNVTHAPAIVGVEEGIFTAHLPGNVMLETTTFNAGPEAVESLFAEALDITYIGPNPAINAFAQSNGEAIRIISGSTSGGAFLVVDPEITSPDDLAGTTISTPQLGNTQDVALRAWLADEGFETDTSGSGAVSIKPQANADILTQFVERVIDGAWVPEPWATRLIEEGGGEVLVDERDLWPDGQFVTTHIIVRTEFLEDHPDVVEAFLQGHLASLGAIANDPDNARTVTNDGLERLTTKRLDDVVLAAAWGNLEFTADPIAASLQGSKDAAVEVGLLDPVELDGIYELSILNALLAASGADEVPGL